MGDLVRVLEKTLPHEIDIVKEIAGTKTAEDAKERAKRNVPVDTGALRRSIRLERIRKKGKTVSIGISAGGFVRNPRTGNIVDYAAYVEFGTRFQRPQPFLRPAMQWAMRNRLKRHVWEAMARIPG